MAPDRDLFWTAENAGVFMRQWWCVLLVSVLKGTISCVVGRNGWRKKLVSLETSNMRKGERGELYAFWVCSFHDLK